MCDHSAGFHKHAVCQTMDSFFKHKKAGRLLVMKLMVPISPTRLGECDSLDFKPARLGVDAGRSVSTYRAFWGYGQISLLYSS